MGCCGEKQPCTGKTVYGVCVQYQSEIIDWKLKDKELGCHTIEEVVEDIVDYLDEIGDTSDMGNDCLQYSKNKDGRITQKTINEKFEEEICNLKEAYNNSDNINSNFKNCNLNYGNLVDDCDKPKNECEFFQFVLDVLKELKNEA